MIHPRSRRKQRGRLNRLAVATLIRAEARKRGWDAVRADDKFMSRLCHRMDAATQKYFFRLGLIATIEEADADAEARDGRGPIDQVE